MRTNPTRASLGVPLAALLSVLLTAFCAPSAQASDRALARRLQTLERDFDRAGLEPGVEFRGEDGVLRPGVRCATRPVADFEQQFIDAAIAEHLREAGIGHRSEVVEIPVAFHVLRKRNGDWNVSDDRIDLQLEVLNRSFEPHGFTFRLESVSRHKRSRFAKKCFRDGVEDKFKRKYAVDPATTLNVYTCRPEDDVLGYAYFPSDYPEDDYLHGVVLLHSSLPGGSAAPYDMGDTAVHEVGHYLGLFHTFEGKCRKKGDRVSDTPREKSAARGCPIGRDTCPEPGLDPVTNFMDYSDDACVEEFTPLQAQRMKDQVETFRPSLAGLAREGNDR